MPTLEQPISLDSVNPQIYCGQYTSDAGKMKLTITLNQKSLFAQLAGNPPFQIYPKGNHQFFGKKLEIQLHFTFNQGIITGLTAERMGQTFNFKKL